MPKIRPFTAFFLRIIAIFAPHIEQTGAKQPQMTLSVIIPVFRVERWLDRCVGSVLEQDCDGMEVILVDDGSPDGCPAICDGWARRDSRITVVHKTNGGLSDARNAGIEAATGECITFVDSDDFLAPGTYGEVMAEMRPGCDIIEYPVFKFYGSPKQERLVFEPKTYTDTTEYWIGGKAYAHAYAWNKIYRRRLFDRGTRFPVGTVFEDVHTLPLLLEAATCVATTDKGMYYYCANAEGITMTADGKALGLLLDGHLRHGNVTADEEYYMHVLNIQMDVYEQTGDEPRLPAMKIKHIGRLNSKARLKAVALNILGVKRLCKLNKLLHRVRRLRS